MNLMSRLGIAESVCFLVSLGTLAVSVESLFAQRAPTHLPNRHAELRLKLCVNDHRSTRAFDAHPNSSSLLRLSSTWAH